MKTEKPYCIVSKKFKAPMSKWRGYTNIHGHFPCIAFQPEKMVRFKSKDHALLYMDNLHVKYPRHAKRWRIGLVKNLKPRVIKLRLK